MKKFVRLRAKAYSYLINDGSEDRKNKRHKNCVIKKVKFGNYKSCVEATEFKNKISYLKKPTKWT